MSCAKSAMVADSRHMQALETVRGILYASGIGGRAIEPLVGGFVNQVYAVDQTYVVRFAQDPTGAARLAGEAELVSRLDRAIPTAALFASGQLGDIAYQVWEFVPGRLLIDEWTRLDLTGKRAIADQLCDILRRIHALPCERVGYTCLMTDTHDCWQDFLRTEIDACVGAINSRLDCAESRQRGQAIRTAFHALCDQLDEDSPTRLVHNDLLPTNIIVQDDRIAAIIDWEFALGGPIDMESYKLECACRQPQIIGRQGDFRELWGMVAERYPEMFDRADLALRLDIYDLLQVWRSFRFEVEAGTVGLRGQLPKVLRMSEDIAARRVARWLPVPS